MPTTGDHPSNLSQTLGESDFIDESLLIDLEDLSPLEKPATLQSAMDQNRRIAADEEQALFGRLHFLRFRREALESAAQSSKGTKKIQRE
ncbi:MAG: hypothetical protein KDA84_24650, partial [Planctomycetaceae bacterium]|nr:hypothetical protein [Planctomycetaceae bacterium]